jgi:nitrite reductase/ring-hydroxylating ferredoxin subunit
VIESERRYVSRTLEGPGAGTEIWTTLAVEAPQRTGVRVEFQVPHVAAGAASRLGAGFRALYTRLWDEDEAMMRHREAMLATRPGAARTGTDAIELGPLDALRAKLPLRVTWGDRPFRIVELADGLHAHATVCPHWLGPLGDAPLEGDRVRCPWHGYRFDVRSGRRCDADSPLRLAPAPRVVVDAATRQVRLVAPD